jgi:hypothetical protein
MADSRDASVREDAPRALPRRVSQTLTGLLEGLDKKQIAERLEISRHTVHTYVKKVYDRFDVNSRSELLALWIAGGYQYGDLQSLRVVTRDLTIAYLRAERARLSLALARRDQEIAQRQEQMSQLKSPTGTETRFHNCRRLRRTRISASCRTMLTAVEPAG